MVNYASVHGYTIVGDQFVDPEDGQDSESGIPAFVDDYTSTELSRPGFDNCLLYLEKFGFDVLIVHAIDRLARDPFNRQVLEREVTARGARVEYVLGNYNESPEGEVKKDLDATFAKWENAKRVERANRGKKRKAEMGKFVSGKPPYGYRINPATKGGIEIYEPEAEVVRMIFRWFALERMSIYQIANHLLEQGIKTSRGLDVWMKSTIATLLGNTAYIGYLYYNKNKRKGRRIIRREESEWIKIECDPIIPKEIFDLAGEILIENKENRRKRPKRFFLLSGMISCSECKYAYTAQFNRHHGGHRGGYRHRKDKGHCSDEWLHRREIEPVVWNAVTEILLDPQSLRRGYEKMMESEREKESRQIKHLEMLNAGIEKLLNKRSRLQTVYLDPDIGMSKAEYLGEKRLIEDQINAAQSEVDRIEKELAYVPSEDDLIQLEEMAGRIVESLGRNLDILEPKNAAL